MATPTRKLEIEVDLDKGLISQIKDPEKKYTINTGTSIPLTGDVTNSKTEFGRVFSALNKKNPRGKLKLEKTMDISEISDEPLRGFSNGAETPTGDAAANEDKDNVAKAEEERLAAGTDADAGTDPAAVPTGGPAAAEVTDVTDALEEAGVKVYNLKTKLDAGVEAGVVAKDEETEKLVQEANTFVRDALNKAKLTNNQDFIVEANELMVEVDELSKQANALSGGARKRRLSRRRQRGSNKKKFLVRNKSKKMRRGKYSRKAK